MTDNQTNSVSDNNNHVRPALIVDAPTMAGYSAFLQHLLVGLADESYHSALICPSKDDADSITLPTVEFIQHPMFKLSLLWLQNKRYVLERLRKFKPTVLHCFSPKKTRLTRYLACRMDVPYILNFNSLNKRFSKASVYDDRCAALIASSKIIAETINRQYRHSADRTVQINTGTFVEDSCVCFSDPRRITSMVIAKRLDNPLDLEPLLSAIRHMVFDGYEFVLVIVGLGRAEKHIHEMISALGLSQVVTVVGDIKPLRSVLAGADIFIDPQPDTHLYSPVLEAMSVGTAVTAGRTAADDLLIEDKTAVLFDADDELSIYACLQRLLDRHEFARRIAAGAQDHLRDHHTVSKMVNAIVKTYQKAQQPHKNNLPV